MNMINKFFIKINWFLIIAFFIIFLLGITTPAKAVSLLNAIVERKTAFDLAPSFWHQVEYNLEEDYNKSLNDVLVLYNSKVFTDKNYERNPFMYLALAHIHTLQGNQGNAEARANEAINYAGNSLARHWLLLTCFERIGLLEQFNSEITTITLLRTRSNALLTPVILNDMLQRGIAALENKDKGRASDYLELANIYAPYDPRVNFALSGLYRQKNQSRWIVEWIKGCLNTFKKFYFLLISFCNGLTYVILSLIVFAILFTISLFIKHIRLVQHSFTKFFPTKAPRRVKNFCTALLLFIPLIWGISILWLWLLIILISWGYYTKREKQFSIPILIIIAILPLSLIGLDYLFSPLESQHPLFSVEIAQHSAWDKNLYTTLSKAEKDTNINPDMIKFTRALLLMRAGQIDKSIAIFKTIKSYPLESGALNNIGSIYLTAGKKYFNNALSYYNKATLVDPKYPTPYKNMLIIYSIALKDEKEKELEGILAELAPNLENEEGHPGSNATDYIISASQILDEYKKNMTYNSKRVSELWAQELIGIPFKYTQLVLPWLIILFIIISYTRQKNDKLTYCESCGRAVCKKCSNKEGYCPECHQMLKGLKSDKMKFFLLNSAQSNENQFNLIRQVLIWFLPGTGHIYYDRTGRAFIVQLILAFTLVFAFYSGIIYPIPRIDSPILILWVRYLISGIIILGLYIYSISSLKRFLKKKQKEELARSYTANRRKDEEE